MPSLPSTLTFTPETGVDIVCSKSNQDNFSVSYRGSAETSTARVVAAIKVMHRDEGSKTNPTERHAIDVLMTYYPLNGSPSYTAQTYVHQIRPRGSSPDVSGIISSGVAQTLNASTTLGGAVLDWGI
jgi:hypothetical protein